MVWVLCDDGIFDDIGLVVEYYVLQSLKCIDMMLMGYGEDGVKIVVIVEFKQWEQVKQLFKDVVVVIYLVKVYCEVVYLLYQVWFYVLLIEGFNEVVYEGGICFKFCVYFYNYICDGVIDVEYYVDYLEKVFFFLKGEQECV